MKYFTNKIKNYSTNVIKLYEFLITKINLNVVFFFKHVKHYLSNIKNFIISLNKKYIFPFKLKLTFVFNHLKKYFINVKNFVIYIQNLVKIYVKNFLYYSIKFDIRLIHFFSENVYGYAFYNFAIIFGFFTNSNFFMFTCFCQLFVCFMLGTVVQTYVLLKIPYTRKFLENLLSIDYIEKYLGKFSFSSGTVKMIKYLGPIVALAVVDVATARETSRQLYESSKMSLEKDVACYKSLGRDPSAEEIKVMFDKSDKYIREASKAKGLISRSFDVGVSNKTISESIEKKK